MLIFFFLIWLALGVFLARAIIWKTFAIRGTVNVVLSIFFNIFLLGLVANIFTSWFKLDNAAIIGSFLLVLAILFLWRRFFVSSPKPEMDREEENGWRGGSLALVAIVVLALWGFVTVFFRQTGNQIDSPWAVLNWPYLLAVSAAVFFSFWLALSRKKVGFVLMGIVIVSMLVHSYLLVYQTGFGGDRWRHLGSENRILAGLEYQPTLLTDNVWQEDVLGFQIPRALVAAPKISYGLQWSMSVIVAKITNWSVFEIDKFIFPVIWSVFSVFLFFIAAWQLGRKKRLALLAAALPAIFYLFQYYGAQTLPLGHGLVFSVFLLALWLAYFKNPSKQVLLLGIFLTALSYFSYSLAFLVNVIMFVIFVAANSRWFVKWPLFAVSAVAVFVIEFFSSANKFNYNFDWHSIVQHLYWQSNLLYFDAGKILAFNFARSSDVAAVLLTLLGILAVWFSWRILKEKESGRAAKFLVMLWVALVISYILSWQFLAGVHTVSRRLNVFIIIPLVAIFAFGFYKNCHSKKALISLSIVLALIFGFTYASGPILKDMVSAGQYQAAIFVWEKIKSDPADYCVIADTRPLLALEALSAKQVVAGNFYSGPQYEQPERGRIFEAARSNPSKKVFDEAFQVTNKNFCYFAVDQTDIGVEQKQKIDEMIGAAEEAGGHWVWGFGKE